MNRTSKPTGKMRLAAETVRQLTSSQMTLVAGGGCTTASVTSKIPTTKLIADTAAPQGSFPTC